MSATAFVFHSLDKYTTNPTLKDLQNHQCWFVFLTEEQPIKFLFVPCLKECGDHITKPGHCVTCDNVISRMNNWGIDDSCGIILLRYHEYDTSGILIRFILFSYRKLPVKLEMIKECKYPISQNRISKAIQKASKKRCITQ